MVDDWDYKTVVFPGGYSPYETRGDCWFDESAARLAVGFSAKYLVHVKGPKGGEPFELERWEVDIVATLFGWKQPDGRRRYRVAYIEIPRGNGKSMLCVVIVGLLLFIDDEPGADVFSAAGTREQSKEVFEPFKTNVLRHPTLSRRTKCYVNSISHVSPETGVVKGVYKAIAADADHQHGGNPHGVIFDELHVQPNRHLWDVLWTGAIKRRNALTAAITTAGFDKLSICYEQRLIADRIRSCRDESYHGGDFLPVVYAADPDDDWKSPATWAKANPNMGVSILESDLAKECQRAVDTPGYENTFKRLHLNIWTEQDVRWLNMDRWDKCGSEDPAGWRATALAELQGKPCYGGLDLSTTTDLTALVLVFPVANGYRVIPWFWVPGERAHERERKDRVPYQLWGKQGFLKLTPGNVIDYDIVRADINELRTMFDIRELAVDRWNATQLLTQLEGDGATVAAHGMGYKDMTAPTKELEKLLLADRIEHGSNPVLRWNASNVTVEQDAAGNLKPSKAKSTERIDGVSALIMALGRAMLRPARSGSIYEERGILSL